MKTASRLLSNCNLKLFLMEIKYLMIIHNDKGHLKSM